MYFVYLVRNKVSSLGMKSFLLVGFLIFATQLLLEGQASVNPKWVVEVTGSIQANDKRLYGWPGRDHLLMSQQNVFGTYQFGVSVGHLFNVSKKLEGDFGIGISVENSNFKRPYDYSFGMEFDDLVIHFTDTYSCFLLQTPVTLKTKTQSRFDFLFGILPQIVFQKTAKFSLNHEDRSWSTFDFYSIEFNPGIEYKISNFSIGLNLRLFQVKKIDKILFNRIISDPRADESLETHNPFKLSLVSQFRF
jgi:hypothetical protein